MDLFLADMVAYLAEKNKHKPYELLTGYYNISHDTLITKQAEILDIYSRLIKAL
jgi:hypothetical protein